MVGKVLTTISECSAVLKQISRISPLFALEADAMMAQSSNHELFPRVCSVTSLPVITIAAWGVWLLPVSVAAAWLVEKKLSSRADGDRADGDAAQPKRLWHLFSVSGKELVRAFALWIFVGGLLRFSGWADRDSMMAALIAAVAAAWALLPNGDPRLLPLPVGRRAWENSLAAGLAGAIALFGVLTLAVEATAMLAPGRFVLELAAPAASGQRLYAELLMAGVAIPFLEEILFRVGLVGWLAPRVGRVLAVFIAAAVFAALHFDASLFAVRCAGGVAMGWVYVRRGDVMAPTIVHAACNTGIMLTPLLWDVFAR